MYEHNQINRNGFICSRIPYFGSFSNSEDIQLYKRKINFNVNNISLYMHKSYFLHKKKDYEK